MEFSAITCSNRVSISFMVEEEEEGRRGYINIVYRFICSELCEILFSKSDILQNLKYVYLGKISLFLLDRYASFCFLKPMFLSG